MRKLIFLLPVFVILFYSCGLLDSGGMNPPDEYDVYHVYSTDLYGDSLKALCNGSEFALSSKRDTLFYLQNSSIYSIALDNNSKHMVTPPGFSVYNFSYSTLNNEIYLGLYYQPYIINPDGSNLRSLSLPDSAKYLNGWAVSSSRKYVAYSYATGLFLMNYDGTKVRLLKDSSNSRTYEYLTFTPNDSAVVYIQDDHTTGKLSLKLFNFFNSTDTTFFS